MEYKIHEAEWTDEKVKKFWDFYNTNPAFENHWFSKAVGKGIIGLVSKYLPMNGKVLDYGTGKGHFTGYLLENKKLDVLSCDFSQETVNGINTQFNDKENFKGCFLVEGFPSRFGENEFDIVFLIEAIEHLTDDYLLPTIAEAKRILKPGGRFVITTPNNENLAEQNVICPDCGCVFHRVQHVRSFTRKSLTSLMENHKFRTVLCEGTDFNQYGEKKSIYKIRNKLMKLLKKSYKPPHLVYIGQK